MIVSDFNVKKDTHNSSEFSVALEDNTTAMDCGCYISLWFGARGADQAGSAVAISPTQSLIWGFTLDFTSPLYMWFKAIWRISHSFGLSHPYYGKQSTLRPLEWGFWFSFL